MALAVCLLFDARSDLLIRELWSRLEDAGVSTLATHTHRRHYPHLSYVVLRSWDLARAQEALAALPAAEPFTMSFHGTLAFPRGRAALAPAITADVALRQWRIVTALEATGAELHRNYQAGQWVPHVSVATRAQGATLASSGNAGWLGLCQQHQYGSGDAERGSEWQGESDPEDKFEGQQGLAQNHLREVWRVTPLLSR